MSLYNLRSNPSGQLPFTITKFDNDLNPESVYLLGYTVCECPAGHLPKCRHRTMLPTLSERVDTAWFWNFENSVWCDPTGAAQINDEAEPLPDELVEDGDITDDPALGSLEGSTKGSMEANIAPQAVDQVSNRSEAQASSVPSPQQGQNATVGNEGMGSIPTDLSTATKFNRRL